MQVLMCLHCDMMGTEVWAPVDGSIVDCVLQRITLSRLAHIAVDDGIHYELLAKLLFLHGYLRRQLMLQKWPSI